MIYLPRSHRPLVKKTKVYANLLGGMKLRSAAPSKTEQEPAIRKSARLIVKSKVQDEVLVGKQENISGIEKRVKLSAGDVFIYSSLRIHGGI